MNTARRFNLAARAIAAGLLAATFFALPASASAQEMCITWPCDSPITKLVLYQNPDLTVSVTATPNPVARGGTHTYVLRVSNFTWATGATSYRGYARPIQGITVSDVRVHMSSYPSNERLISARDDTGTGFTCYTPAEYFGMDVRCVGGTIPSGGTAQITLTMSAPTTLAGFTVNANVDPYSQIAESDENNNSSVVSFSTT